MPHSPWTKTRGFIFITPSAAIWNRYRRALSPPNIVYRGDEPVEYGVLPFQQYGKEYCAKTFSSVSSMLETYYASKARSPASARNPRICGGSCRPLWNATPKAFPAAKQMKDTAKKKIQSIRRAYQHLRLRSRGRLLFFRR